MHSTTISSTSNSKSSSSSIATVNNVEQYPYPPISTLRRASRPSNIDLSLFDHNNSQHSNDPGIYSAPICYVKQTNNHQPQQQQQHIQQTSHPYTASFPYQQQHQQQHHIQLPSHHHHQHPTQQQHNIQLYPQTQQQQQQLLDPFSQHQHIPHTFPLQTSPNHYPQFFYFPPSTLQANATSNGHRVTNPNQSSTSTHNHRLRAVQIQEQWSNPVLSPLMVKRMNENAASMSIDDDEDPSASIDALVADVDSGLLDDQQNKSLNESKASSTTPAAAISPSPHIYLRSSSHILTTPPNPLASDDHPDNQLTVGNNFSKTYSPLPSAGFELNNVGSKSTGGVQCFNFDGTILDQTDLKHSTKSNLNGDNKEDNNQEKTTQPHMINPDARIAKISSNSFIQDDNSNQSSTNSSSQNSTLRIFGQMLQSAEQQRLSSSPPPPSISVDMKLSPLEAGHNQSSQQQNRHSCTHPDCNKVFANKSALAKHKLTHSQDRKHKCSKCNKGFKRLDHLHGHMLTHEEEKPHKCRVPNCNRTYCDARSLKRHIENTHQDILAAIHTGVHNDYKHFLPETAFVKTKDPSLNSEFSIDSVDSNSPQSLIDTEQSFTIRASTGNKMLATYTFDEEKYVECQICKKTFKNGAALNGHMRLHGGFNEKQPSPSSGNHTPSKKKRSAASSTIPKRKRLKSPSTLITIKKEEQDVPMIPPVDHPYQSQTSFANLPSSSQQLLYEQMPSSSTTSRIRSASSSLASNGTASFSAYSIKNPLSVQAPARQTSMSAAHGFNQSRMLNPNITIRSDGIGNQHTFPNSSVSVQQHGEDKHRKTISLEIPTQNRQINGMNSYTAPYLSNFSNFQVAVPPTIPPNLLHQLLHQPTGPFNSDSQHVSSSSINPSARYTPSSHFGHSPIPNATSIINTQVTSPYSHMNISHCSPPSSSSTSQMGNKNTNATKNRGMEVSPATLSTSSSCSSTSSSSHAPKKRFLHTSEQETYDETQPTVVEEQPCSLKIVLDNDSPVKKITSGFLIATPSSTGTNSSSSSTSNHTHFNYDNVPPLPPSRTIEPTPSSFHWPSQFRRQLSLNIGYQMVNPLPSTPYTPPPMLSPFRKGPGLYYRVFSHPGPSIESSSIPTTPVLPFTPASEESAGPKINIGRDYQAIIPKLRTVMDDEDDSGTGEELLFSSTELPYLDEKALEKFEQLNRMNPFLFSPRHSPTSYPLELVYMLLHEYNGDLQRTLAALLEGTATDIKQCRPLHRYRFPECDTWTNEEIDAFTRATQISEKNFELVSRAVGSKNVKQCVEFYYMPKVNSAGRKISPTGTSSVITRQKRCQMLRAKQTNDETPSSPSNDFRIDENSSTMYSDNSPATQFSCDIDECPQIFTTERSCRAHRKEHRRGRYSMVSSSSTKRSRNLD